MSMAPAMALAEARRGLNGQAVTNADTATLLRVSTRTDGHLSCLVTSHIQSFQQCFLRETFSCAGPDTS
jgi:hypothetical protein